jgi:NADPH2:quinone reductase
MMRALELHTLSGPDGLVLVEREDPPADDAVLIDVRAAGVSFPDLLLTQGRYQVQPELPTVPGLEVAGVVRSAPDSGPVRAGDRAWAALEGGGFADVVVAPADRVFPLADELDFVQGAALPVNFLTAVFALHRRAHLERGETVLVLGAAGGLGSALVSVAAHMGAQVIAVVSTADKARTAEEAGADAVVVGTDWREQVLEHTSGRGVDLAADPVGGDATLEGVRSTAAEGRVLILGFASGEIPAVPTNRLLLRNVSLVGVGLGALVPFAPELMRETADELMSLVREGLRPIIGGTFPLEQGAQALRALENRAARGKLVLTMNGDGG